ncbi:hypothetical protein M378DRAFT_93361, partial [Amanita muscaria Koide BX008]
QYQLAVDRYAHIRRRRPELEMRDFFGRVLQFFVVDIPTAPEHSISQQSIVFAVVRQMKITRQSDHPLRLCYFKDDNGRIEIIDLNQIQCLVGRAYDRNEWSIVDRNTSTAPIHM